MATEEQMQQLADESVAILNDPMAEVGRLNLEVARLETELAKVKGELIATLLNMAQVVGERNTAQAAIAAKDAALKGRCCTVEIDGEGNVTHEQNCPLSPDVGKGKPWQRGAAGRRWLPPEALRFIWIMREVARTVGGRDDPQMMSWYYAAQSELWRLLRATLDALKGVK